jgi:hypothetical protein
MDCFINTNLSTHHFPSVLREVKVVWTRFSGQEEEEEQQQQQHGNYVMS